MMPGITAMQQGLPIAGTSAIRKAPSTSDDRFSQAMDERPKAATQADTKPDEAAPQRRQGRPARARDGRDKAGDDDKKKDKDDADGAALPPHMKAERALAQQWSGSVPTAATAQGTAAGSLPAGSTKAATPATGIVQAVPPTDANGTDRPTTTLLMQGQMQGLPAPAGKDGKTGTATPMPANPAGTDPMPKGVSVVTATAADAEKAAPGSISTTFMAKVAASQQGAGLAGSQQGAGGAASVSAPDAKPALSQILQATAGQGAGNADANTDGKGDGGNGQPDGRRTSR